MRRAERVLIKLNILIHDSPQNPVAIPANLAIVHFVILRRLHFDLGFRFSAGPRDEFPRDSSLIISLLSCAGFSVYLLTSNTESCDEDDDEV